MIIMSNVNMSMKMVANDNYMPVNAGWMIIHENRT